MFVKVIHNSIDAIILDVFDVDIDRPKYVKWNPDTKEFGYSNVIEGNGLVSKDGTEVYCIANYDIGFVGYNKPYKKAYIAEISETEYNILKDTIKSNFIDVNGNIVSFNSILTSKIEDLSKACEHTIKNGVDLVMEDGISHHFSFEVEDQMKISKLNDRVKAGETFLPYHADNELCRVFNADEITRLNTAMESTVEYQITYFNSLKLYLSNISSDDKFTVYNAYYGMEIPEEYRSDVLKILESNLTKMATYSEVVQ